MNYDETVQWMFSRLPMYQRQGEAAFKNKLDGIRLLSSYLGNPHRSFKTIHVGGTNGKGSSSHMLASILQESGYPVGLYTSPHLKDFRERIKINGIPVSKAFVIGFIKRNKNFFEKHPLSFFEMTVGMAFDYFARKKVDIAVIEVGLGGRLDSTNIITPEVSLITNIGMDHTHMLGNSPEQIAFEKAGIIKPRTPVVISEYTEDTFKVFKRIASERNSELVLADELDTNAYKTDLLGDYQKKNMAGVLAVISHLKQLKITDRNVKRGLMRVVENTGLMGRWQIINRAPMVVCDAAHNREGLSVVMKQLKKQTFRKLHMVLGFVNDKNLDEILPFFPENAQYYFCRPDVPRGLNTPHLMEKAKRFGLKGTSFNSVLEAYEAALKNANNQDFIYIGGSTFVVAEVV